MTVGFEPAYALLLGQSTSLSSSFMQDLTGLKRPRTGKERQSQAERQNHASRGEVERTGTGKRGSIAGSAQPVAAAEHPALPLSVVKQARSARGKQVSRSGSQGNLTDINGKSHISVLQRVRADNPQSPLSRAVIEEDGSEHTVSEQGPSPADRVPEAAGSNIPKMRRTGSSQSVGRPGNKVMEQEAPRKLSKLAGAGQREQPDLVSPSVSSKPAGEQGSAPKRETALDSGQLQEVLQHLRRLDNLEVFYKPVDEAVAPNYFKVIRTPMSFSVMEQKVGDGQYLTWSAFVADFERICNNAMTYNMKRSKIHTAAMQMLRQGRRTLKQYEGKVAVPDAIAPSPVGQPSPSVHEFVAPSPLSIAPTTGDESSKEIRTPTGEHSPSTPSESLDGKPKVVRLRGKHGKFRRKTPADSHKQTLESPVLEAGVAVPGVESADNQARAVNGDAETRAVLERPSEVLKQEVTRVVKEENDFEQPPETCSGGHTDIASLHAKATTKRRSVKRPSSGDSVKEEPSTEARQSPEEQPVAARVVELRRLERDEQGSGTSLSSEEEITPAPAHPTEVSSGDGAEGSLQTSPPETLALELKPPLIGIKRGEYRHEGETWEQEVHKSRRRRTAESAELLIDADENLASSVGLLPAEQEGPSRTSSAQLQMPGVQEEDDLDIDITGGNVDEVEMEELKQARYEGETETSSSYAETLSDVGQGLEDFGEEVTSRGEGLGSGLLRDAEEEAGPSGRGQRSLNPDWKRNRRGVEWRCRWLEIRMQELQRQTERYAGLLTKLQNQRPYLRATEEGADAVEEEGKAPARALPVEQVVGSSRRSFRPRKRRRRVEDVEPTRQQMAAHPLFSRYDKEVRRRQGLASLDLSMEDMSPISPPGFSPRPRPFTRTIGKSRFAGQSAHPHDTVLIGEPGDDSFEALLGHVDDLEAKVKDLRTQLQTTAPTPKPPLVKAINPPRPRAQRPKLQGNSKHSGQVPLDRSLSAPIMGGGLGALGRPSSGNSLLGGRKRSAADFDISDVVMPAGMGHRKAVEQLRHQDIATPQWKVIERAKEVVDDGEESDEDTSDEAYLERHAAMEAREKTRYLLPPKNRPSGKGSKGSKGKGKGKSMVQVKAEHGGDSSTTPTPTLKRRKVKEDPKSTPVTPAGDRLEGAFTESSDMMGLGLGRLATVKSEPLEARQLHQELLELAGQGDSLQGLAESSEVVGEEGNALGNDGEGPLSLPVL